MLPRPRVPDPIPQDMQADSEGLMGPFPSTPAMSGCPQPLFHPSTTTPKALKIYWEVTLSRQLTLWELSYWQWLYRTSM